MVNLSDPKDQKKKRKEKTKTTTHIAIAGPIK